MDDKKERRAPVHGDAIAITEFSLDSLACTTERISAAGALCDGQFFQMEVSRPGQVPFGVLLPRGLDNLVVVTTVSATHVGWGTIRQTPTLMHLAESAAWALVLASRARIAPAALDVGALQRHLVQHGVMISFFNDFDMTCREPWVPAVQYFGARGFFSDYDARPLAPLDSRTAAVWNAQASALRPGIKLAGPTRATALAALFDSIHPARTAPRVPAGRER